ncbi:hypothetical protein ACM01_05455 [Streptomyces viridochromogenes]|uniref:Uncharacterized protein n=1 Tax=Streptomyces viridochromogenes TaxID=1938 RepID=A0A0J7ZL64_STRVR|nr:hypothetical protein [Streptomyces viridochromogenes]KMS76162.1 hypothetical protein ACM01_05455 [Streptomyces viridochromogenes]
MGYDELPMAYDELPAARDELAVAYEELAGAGDRTVRVSTELRAPLGAVRAGRVGTREGASERALSTARRYGR